MGDIVPCLLYFFEPYHRLAERQNSRIQLMDWPGTLELDFDPEKIETLQGNLLSNALANKSLTKVIIAAIMDRELSENVWIMQLIPKII